MIGVGVGISVVGLSDGAALGPPGLPTVFRVILGGQSNAENSFGKNSFFIDAMEDFTGEDSDVGYIDGATSGSQMISANGGTYWINHSTLEFGPAMATFEAAVAAYSGRILAIVFDQGESDYIMNFGFQAAHKTGALAVMAHIHDITGGADIFIRIPNSTSNGGSGWDGTNQDGSVQGIRENWLQIINEVSYVYAGSERFDLAMGDSQHISTASQEIVVVRDARQIAKHLGYEVAGSTLGPVISNVSRSGATVTVTLSHDGGTDFTPTTAIQGFYFTQNGTKVAINSAVRTNATTITLTLASTPSGTMFLYYIWGNNKDISDLSKLVRDNSPQALPLRCGKWSVT